MARRKSLRAQLDDLIEQFAPEIRAAFLEAIAGVVDNVILADVIAAIELGDPIAAFRNLGMDDGAMRPVTAVIERAFEVGGVTTGATFPRAGASRTLFRFDVRNSRAEAYLRDQSSKLVTRITSETREAVQNTMARGVQAGRNPRNVALDIVGRINPVTKRREGGVVGLSAPQERWTANARRDLQTLDERYFSRKMRDKRFDSVVRKAIDNGKPLPAETVSKLVGRYNDNLLKLRGETIGRTEAIGALNRSSHEAFSQAVDKGMVKPNAVKRIWDSAGNDGRTRDSHVDMDGQAVELDEPFVFPDGSQAMFPGDGSLGAPAEEIINCRCRERIEVDWLYGVA